MTELSTNLFNFVSKNGKTIFSADASQLGDKNLQFLSESREIKPGNVGFPMKSTRTGNVITFVLTKIKTFDGDILSWEYVPSEKDIRTNPKAQFFSAVIFND